MPFPSPTASKGWCRLKGAPAPRAGEKAAQGPGGECPQPRGPACRIVGPQFTSIGLTRTAGAVAGRGCGGLRAQRPGEGEAEHPAGLGTGAGQLAWVRPHLLGNLQRAELVPSPWQPLCHIARRLVEDGGLS